jgi:hypothetical protein
MTFVHRLSSNFLANADAWRRRPAEHGTHPRPEHGGLALLRLDERSDRQRLRADGGGIQGAMGVKQFMSSHFEQVRARVEPDSNPDLNGTVK